MSRNFEELYYEIKEKMKHLEEENRKIKNKTRYGLVWEDHPEVINEDSFPLLQEDHSLKISNGGQENLLIEGDNYHSLRSLLYTHKGKIDVIYIDPPYNTGNKDFIYNDKIIDSDDLYRHSKWLSFMEKRLKLARELMSDNSVIFVSIDDNEQAQLKLLMDQIFGERNFVSNFIWEKGGGNSLSHTTRSVTEYILAYAKEIEGFELIHSNEKQKGDSSLYNSANKEGKLQFKPGEVYFPFTKEGIVYKRDLDRGFLSENINIKDNYNTNSFTVKDRWKWTQGYLEKQLKQGTKIISKSSKLRLRYLKDTNVKIRPRTLLDREVGYTLTGSRELQNMGVQGFDYPKPTKLLKYLIKLLVNKNATVLDFFAGSGTTGHAVLELNKEDGGNRKFILCTNNEVSEEIERRHLFEKGVIPKNNKTEFRKYKENYPNEYKSFKNSKEYEDLGIARAITHERIKRVINGYTTPRNKKIEGLPGSLRYFKTKEVGSINLPSFSDVEDIIDSVEDLLKIKHSTFELTEGNERYSIFENNSETMCYLKDVFSYNEICESLKDNDKTKYIYIVSRDDETYLDAKRAIKNTVCKTIFKNIPSDIQKFFRRHLGGEVNGE